MLKGSYILILEVPGQREMMVGKLGHICFAPGFYAYVGSALNGLEARLYRHLRKEKKLHWHIDYLLHDSASIAAIIVSPGLVKKECLLAQALGRRLLSIRGFGCSDCRCSSHLYFSGEKSSLIAHAAGAFRQAGISFQFWSEPDSGRAGRHL